MKPFHGFRKGFVRERASEQLQSVMWPFHKGLVKERASAQLQSVIKPSRKVFALPKQRASEQLRSVINPLLKGYVKVKASDRLQSVIKPFLKRICKERASEQYSIAKWSFELQKPIKAYGFW